MLADVPVDFQGGTVYEPGVIGDMVIDDAAFVTDKGRRIIVLASAEDNNIALVDMNDNYRVRKLNVAPTASESTELGSERSVEWAVDTDYVWVSGREAEQQYIIEIPDGIDSARLVKTIASPTGGHLLFVNNWERVRSVQLMQSMIDGAVSDMNVAQPQVSATMMAESSDAGNSIGVAGLIIGLVALVAALGAVYLTQTDPKKETSITGTKEDDLPSLR